TNPAKNNNNLVDRPWILRIKFLVYGFKTSSEGNNHPKMAKYPSLLKMNRFITILFLFSLGACHQEAEKGNYRIIKEEDFDVISITSKKYYFEEIINPSNIGLIDGKVLVSEAWRVPEEHPRIHIIDSKDWTYDKPKGKHGEGPLEVTDAGLFFKGNNPDEGLFLR